MSKIKITFKFDKHDIDDKACLNRIIHADGAYGSLYSIMSDLRNEYKYKNDDNLEVLKFVEKKINEYYEILSDNGIDLDRDYL